MDGDENLHGVVLGTNDMIHFQGKDVPELRQSLQEGVEDYLAWCRAEGREPEKPYSGKFNVRIPPGLHRRIALLAQGADLSLNEWLVRALTQQADQEQAPEPAR